MSRCSISSRSPGFAPFTYTGPVSGCATVRSIFSRSFTVVRGPICRSIASRVSSVTSSPGSTSITGAMSGCQRLCPLLGSSRSRFVRSMLMFFAMLIPPRILQRSGQSGVGGRRAHAGAARAEMGREVGAQIARIVAGSIDEARLAAPQKWQTHDVQARRLRHNAAVVADVALGIEDRDLQPGVVGAKPRRPDDGPDSGTAEIEPEWRRCFYARRLGPMRRIDRAVHAVLRGPLVERVQQPVLLEVGQLAEIAQRPG